MRCWCGSSSWRGLGPTGLGLCQASSLSLCLPQTGLLCQSIQLSLLPTTGLLHLSFPLALPFCISAGGLCRFGSSELLLGEPSAVRLLFCGKTLFALSAFILKPCNGIALGSDCIVHVWTAPQELIVKCPMNGVPKNGECAIRSL